MPYKNRIYFLTLLWIWLVFMSNTGCNSNGNPDSADIPPDVPRVDYVEMADTQDQGSDSDIIWYDDFNNGERSYLESTGDIDPDESFGGTGGSMKAGFKKGEVNGEGNRKLAFGDFPGSASKIVRPGEKFDEIYWRIYVKHEYGWEGAPAKMSRATSIVTGDDWRQAMIAHVWSGKGNSLTLDPARGVDGQSDKVITMRYNDFKNLSWLGNKPSSKFQISSTEESGRWILVEAQARLNTPGLSDGENRLWIDGRLEAVRENLNFRGSYTGHGINAVFLESYWNDGAAKTERRWYDNFVVSTKPIGPVICPSNPVLTKTPYHGPGKLKSWEFEIALDYDGKEVVYRSDDITKGESARIYESNGNFMGFLQDSAKLRYGNIYFCRVRQQSTNGSWSDWSRWHQPFKVK